MEMTMRSMLFVLAVAAAAAPVAAREGGVPVGTPNGAPVDCVNLGQVRETHVRSDRVIDFEMNNRTILRNTLSANCPQLGFEERFIYSVTNNQLCSVDTISVLDSSGQRGATCGLGKFQPVTLAK
jgi:hypothetical protein